jgi:hypothetical protein
MTFPNLGPGGRWALLALAAGLLLVLPGCGCDGCCSDGCYVPPPAIGNVYVDNLTDTTIPEYCLAFRLAPIDGPFTGNLLLQDLPPATTQFVGTFSAYHYDAEADMEFGDLVTWFDVPVPAADDTFFEIY